MTIFLYRKCGNSNSKNDSHLWLDASAFLQRVDFTAFAVNVKAIALEEIFVSI